MIRPHASSIHFQALLERGIILLGLKLLGTDAEVCLELDVQEKSKISLMVTCDDHYFPIGHRHQIPLLEALPQTQRSRWKGMHVRQRFGKFWNMRNWRRELLRAGTG